MQELKVCENTIINITLQKRKQHTGIFSVVKADFACEVFTSGCTPNPRQL
jgi:hypothetical protein